MALLIDVLLLAILAFCIWQGYRKGLILTVAGVVVIVLSVILASQVATAYAEPFSENLYPIMSWLGGDELDEAALGKGKLEEITSAATIAEIAREAYESLGISSEEVDKMVDAALTAMAEREQDARTAITSTLLYSLSYLLLCLAAFVVFMVAFTLLIHLLAAMFKLPVFNLIDKIGGVAVGALYGILILCVIGWAARYLGVALDAEIVESTTVLELFINHNMLKGILGF